MPRRARSLRVGSTQSDEYYRMAINSTGHRLDFEFFGRRLQDLRQAESDHTYLERRVSNQSGQDAFLRPFAGVLYAYRFTDLTLSRTSRPSTRTRRSTSLRRGK